MNKVLYISTLFFVMTQSYASDAGQTLGIHRVTNTLTMGGDDIVFSLDNILGYLIGLFYFISVALIIYGGFVILTSGGDEDRVKKGKNTIIYVVIGLIVVFLASQIVNWIIRILSDSEIVG